MNSKQQAEFEAWASKQGRYGSADCPVDYRRGVTRDAEKVWQAALESPEVKALREALQEVVDAADGEGWEQLDPGMEKQRAALAAMEKQK